MRITVKAHSLNGGCRTLFEGRRLTGIFYIKCATLTAATGSFFATHLRGGSSGHCEPGGQGLHPPGLGLGCANANLSPAPGWQSASMSDRNDRLTPLVTS